MSTPKEKVRRRHPQAYANPGNGRSTWAVYTSRHASDFVCLSQGWSTAANAWHAAWEKIFSEDSNHHD